MTATETPSTSRRERVIVNQYYRIENLRGYIKSLCPIFRDMGRDDLADACIEAAGDMADRP